MTKTGGSTVTVTSRPQALDLDALRGQFQGRVIGPNDDDYDTARMVMFGGIDRHPAVVIRVANVDDVKRVIALARETRLELAVRSGGHSAKGDSTTEGGIVLDLHDLTAIDIDPAARTMWAEAGNSALAGTQAAAKHGLPIGFRETRALRARRQPRR